MSVRIRPGGDSSPEYSVDEDLDRVPDQSRIRAVFAPDHESPDDQAPDFERPVRGTWLTDLPLRRPSWSQAVAVVVLAGIAVLVIGGLVTRLSTGNSAPVALATPASASPPAAPSPAPSATQSSPAPTAEAATAVSWQGAALPVHSVAGPRVFTATRAYGFAHDPLGAALAAVHISTHLDPYTGPRVFGPVIKEQVVAAPTDLLATTTRTYEAAARQRGYDDRTIAKGRPVLAPTGEIRSWAIEDYRSDRATVQLLVASPNGDQVVYRIPVRWVSGDWAVSLADAGEQATFDVARAGRAETKDFRPFTTRGN